MITVVYCTRKIVPEFIEMIHLNVGLEDVQVIPFENNGERSLSQVYNEGMRLARYPIICFIHDDITFDTPNWGRKLLRNFRDYPDFGIIGVAGTTHLMDGKWWTDRKAMKGIVNHSDGYKRWVSRFSVDQEERIHDVIILDGVFMAIDKRKIKHLWDESFQGFHFYDLAFTFTNFLDGVRVGVMTNIRITHRSVGKTNAAWEANKIKFERMFEDSLPVQLPPRVHGNIKRKPIV